MRLPIGPWTRHDVVRYKNVKHKPTKLDHFLQNNFNSVKNVKLIYIGWFMIDNFESYKKSINSTYKFGTNIDR